MTTSPDAPLDLADAAKPETRARRIAQFVAMLARGQKIHS
jgi:uncharacterized protein YdeI (YjbR/CyaY-like superfamily)